MADPDSIDLLRRDHSALAATVGNLTIELRLTKDFIIEIQTDRAVRKERDQLEIVLRAERDKSLNDRLGRIEHRIEEIRMELRGDIAEVQIECSKDFNSIKVVGTGMLLTLISLALASIYKFFTSGALASIIQ